MAYAVPDQEHCLRASNLPNFAVWIEIDNQAVPVYSKTESEDHKTVTCYIESAEGKNFVVRFADLRTSPPEDAYDVCLNVDGAECRGLVTTRSDELYGKSQSSRSRFMSFAAKDISDSLEEPFLFSKLELTDDDSVACTDENALKSLGTIDLKYRRIKNIGGSAEKTDLGVATKNKFHEKTKKAQLSHQTTFGAPVKKKTIGKLSFESIDNRRHPFLSFEFRYRSRQLLQMEKHIPDSPISSPHGSPALRIFGARERDEEIARLQRQLDALKKASASASPGPSGTRKIKSEDENGRQKKRAKKEKEEEGSSASAGKGKGKEKEVIVLSDSD